MAKPVNVRTVSSVHNQIRFPTTGILSRTMTPIRRGYASDIRKASQ